MARPPAYTRDTSFSDWETNHPGEPKPGASLDTEYDDVALAINGTQAALELIQRDDGQLANDSVGMDQLQDDVFDGIGDTILADCEEQAAIATAAAASATANANAAFTHASAANNSKVSAQGAATQAAAAQGIAQGAAAAAQDSAEDAAESAVLAENATNETEQNVADTEAAVDMAYKWAEYLAGPVGPAIPPYPEAVDDGMWSAKWWALRARDYSGVSLITLPPGGTDIGDAIALWLGAGNALPPGNIIVDWNGDTYWLIAPADPTDPNSWIKLTGDTGPAGADGLDGAPGPPNSLTIGTVTTLPPGSPAGATITGTPPTQTLNLALPQGATGSGGSGAGGNPTALIGLTAIPGVATDLIRSDGAPALSQAIAPTWTGSHTFAGNTTIASVLARLRLNETDASAGNKMWGVSANTEQFELAAFDDTFSTKSTFMLVDRTLNVIDSIALTSTALTWNGSQLARLSDLAGAVSGANPTASLGLTAINGSAVTFMRSDAAPALNVGITPTWTANHIFSGDATTFTHTNGPLLRLTDPDAALDVKNWRIRNSNGTFQIVAEDDARVSQASPLQILRTGTTIDTITLVSTALTWNGQAMVNIASSPTWTGAHTWSASSPRLKLNATGAASDNKLWAIQEFSNGTFVINTRTDADGNGADALTITRTGTAITTIALSSTALTWNGSRLITEATNPVTWTGQHKFDMGTSADPLWLVGADANNTVFLPFYRGNGSTRRGYLGWPNGGTADLNIVNEEAAQILITAGPAQYVTCSRGLLSLIGNTTPQQSHIAFGDSASAGINAYIGWAGSTNDIINGITRGAFGIRTNAANINFSVNNGASAGMIFDASSNLSIGANMYISGGNIFFGTAARRALSDYGDGYLRLNDGMQYASGTYTPGAFRCAGTLYFDAAAANVGATRILQWNAGGMTYGSCYVQGGQGGYSGYGIGDALGAVFMSNGSDVVGIHLIGDGKWLLYRSATNFATCSYNLSAPSFNATSSRAIKRETGALTRAAKILRQLRPILYRLLNDESREQIGLIAEEVHDVCPQLSDGKTVSYDRLALLLLADWQAQNGIAYE